MRGISTSQTHLSLPQRRQEERRAETTENRHQTMYGFSTILPKETCLLALALNCFNYLLLLNIIIGLVLATGI